LKTKMYSIFYLLITTFFIQYNESLYGMNRLKRVVSAVKPEQKIVKFKKVDYKKAKNQINTSYPTFFEKTPTSEALTPSRVTTLHQIGHEATKNAFKIQKTGSAIKEGVGSIVKIAAKHGNEKDIQNVVEKTLTDQDIIKKISEFTGKTLEEVEQIQQQIQEKVPEPEIAKGLADNTVAIIQNNALLQETVKQRINSQVTISAQVIFALLQKSTIPQQIVEQKAPFEITTIPKVSFETTLDLMTNPEARAENANVSFKGDQVTKDIIVQESKTNNLAPLDFTVQSMQEISSGNESPEANAIINKDGYVATSLTEESINKLEETLGPKIKEIFAKDSEFLNINEKTNSIDSIITTNNKGDAVIIADGLKSLETLPESSKKLIQEIVDIETKNALSKIPSLIEQLNNAFSKKQDPVLKEAEKEVTEASEKLLTEPDKPPTKDFPPSEPKLPQQVISATTKVPQVVAEQAATTVAESPGTKKLPAPEKPPIEERPLAEIKQPQQVISAKTKVPQVVAEQATTTVAKPPEAKKLPVPEKPPMQTTPEPGMQKPVPSEKPKSLAETVKEKAGRIRESKPLEGATKTPVSPTLPFTAPPETFMIGAGKEPLFIASGLKPIETGVETLPFEVVQRTIVQPKQLLAPPVPQGELTRIAPEGGLAPTPLVVSQAPLITTPELKLLPQGLPQPKAPSGEIQEMQQPKRITEIPTKKVTASDAQIDTFGIESSEVIKNFKKIGDVFLEKTNLDMKSPEPQVEQNINELITQNIETSQSQLKEAQNTLQKTLETSKDQKSTQIVENQIQNTVLKTKEMLNRTNENTKTMLDGIIDPALKKLAKDASDLITRAAQKSLTSIDILARISAELTNLNNGNFTNAKELTQRLQGLKRELEAEIREQQKQANELTQMHVREKRQHTETAKKSTLLSTILKALVGIIAAIAIEEFDSKQIDELSQQITDAQELIGATETPVKIITQEQETKTAKKRFLPLINQSTQLKNRTITTALQAPDQLRLIPISYEIPQEITSEIPTKEIEPEKIMPETKMVWEKMEEQELLPPFFNATRETIAFQNEQDSELLGEQLHQIEKKVEKKLETSEKRASRARKKTEEQTISDYKKMYSSADAKEQQPSKEESAITQTTPTGGRSYTPSYGYEPTFDHSYDMFDFSGLPSDFENFDVGYFGDLDFLSEFGFEDWEMFGKEYPEISPQTTHEREMELKQHPEAMPITEEPYPSVSSPDTREQADILRQEKELLMAKEAQKSIETEEQTQAPHVIRTPYTQYLAPALAVITIGCALLFYWFM